MTDNSFYRPYKGLKPFVNQTEMIKKLRVFIVPIRDWNYFALRFALWISFCFYRPYKGLKLESAEEFEPILPKRFYRPYKGLKLQC